MNRRRDVHARSREWFRRLETIPAFLCIPKCSGRNREWQNWIARLLREQDRSHLGDVARALRAIDRKRRRTSGAHQPHHLHDRSGGAARRRTASRAITESLNEARDVFAVETPRSHHDDAAPPPKVSCEEDAVMPEGGDRYLTVARCRLPIIPAFDL